MKKIITLLCVAAMAAVILCGCKMGKCDFCGETGILTEHSLLGTDFYLCSDCSN